MTNLGISTKKLPDTKCKIIAPNTQTPKPSRTYPKLCIIHKQQVDTQLFSCFDNMLNYSLLSPWPHTQMLTFT